MFPTTKKEYELKYAGKQRKEVILNDTMSVPFQPVKYFGNVENEEWANMLIFGDNLQALKHLLKLKNEGYLRNHDGSNGIKLVYIDPPFATKQDFQGFQEQKAYIDKVMGAEFIEFLRKRLIFIKELLTDDGSVFVHLDQRKSHYIKVILDELFTENHFQNQIIWQSTTAHNDAVNKYGQIHQIIFWYYNKTKPKYYYDAVRDDISEANLREYSRLELPDGTVVNYKGNEHLEGRRFRTVDATWKGKSPDKQFTWRGCRPKSYREWKYNLEGMEATLQRGDLFLADPNRGAIRCQKMYLDKNKGLLLQDIWTNVGRMSGGKGVYPTQKPEVLIDRIIRSVTKEGDLVMDIFAGSGTTGAVTEKLDRRWIMVDCGKLAIYTIQKRMMDLKEDIGNKGNRLKHKPFVLYNAGLYYDGKLLEQMKEDEYKDFVLELFGCQKRNHIINGLEMNGTLNNHSVMVFDKQHYLTYEFVDALHKNIGSFIKDALYIIAPVGVVGFNEDYIKKGNIKYIILRIPNSIIEYIREKKFTRLKQPRSLDNINQTIDTIGFDFIYPPVVKAQYYQHNPRDKLIDKEYVVRIEEFNPVQLGSNIVEFEDPKSESLAMVMIDLNYNGETFNLDKYYFGDEITKNNFSIKFDDEIGERVMIIYLDIFGNEKKEVISKNEFVER